MNNMYNFGVKLQSQIQSLFKVNYFGKHANQHLYATQVQALLTDLIMNEDLWIVTNKNQCQTYREYVCQVTICL
jgi:hypothetical protein